MRITATGVLARLLVPAFFVAGAVAMPAMAQEKKADKKAAKPAAGKVIVTELAQNDQFRAYEARFRPGDEASNVARPMRVVRALKGGTLERIYPDGKRQRVVWKTGETRIVGPDEPFIPKNVGKSQIVLYVVQLKKQ